MMTPELLFDRPRLVAELRPRLIAWAQAMLTIIEEHAKDADATWTVEEIIKASKAMGLPLGQSCYHSGGSEAEDVVRNVHLELKSNSRDIFSFAPNANGNEENTEDMAEMIAQLSKEEALDPTGNKYIKIAHAMGVEMMLKEGRRAFAIDPIALRILDHISDDAMERYKEHLQHSMMESARVIPLTKAEPGRGLRHISNANVVYNFRQRVPSASYSNDGKSDRSKPFNFINFVITNDILSVKSQRHEKGSIRSETLFIEQAIPEAAMMAFDGHLLDSLIETPITKGMGLRIKNIEPSSGLKPGIAIHTDALEKLHIVEFQE